MFHPEFFYGKWQFSFHKENCHPANEFILLCPMSFQGSFKNGVVSASPCLEIIDSTDFFRILQNIAVANKKHSNHIKTPFVKQKYAVFFPVRHHILLPH